MPRAAPRSKTGKKRKMGKVMHEFKAGELRSGSKTGPKVKDRKQAIAIGMNESGQSNRGRRARNKRVAGYSL